MSPWILASRPKTLPAAFVPVWVGALPLLLDGDPTTGSWGLFWATLASCLCIQIATNLFNDAIDHHKGADTGKRLGPVRATASGLLSPRAVMTGAIAFCLLATLIAVPLVIERGWPVVAIGAVSLYFAYGYTGGPFPLAYRGMGEFFVILFFGFAAVFGSHFVQTGEIGDSTILVLALQCGLYSSALIAINNLRDLEEDGQTGKRTLAVRFGKTFARFEIASFCFVPLLLWAALLRGEDSPEAGPTLAALLAVSGGLAAFLARRIFATEPGPTHNRYLALAAVQLLFFAGVATWYFS